jgi:hypothetical protein
VSRRSRWGTGIVDRTRDVATVVTRATPVPLGVRCGVFLAGLVAIVVAYPGWVLFARPGLLLLALPLLPALRPRGRLPTLLALAAVIGWLVSTTVGDGRVELWSLLVLTAALYLLHSLAALAAVLPYDAVVPPDVVGGWLLRALAVLLASAVLAVLALAAAGATGDRKALVAALLGLAVAAALPGLLAWLLRRPTP